MSRLRPQHCFWIAGICFVAGLTAWWQDDVPLASSHQKGLRPPTGATEIVRARGDGADRTLPAPARDVRSAVPAPPPASAPQAHPPERTPVLMAPDSSPVASSTIAPEQPAERIGASGTTGPDLVTASFQAGPAMPSKAAPPEAVWLSGRIEILDSH